MYKERKLQTFVKELSVPLTFWGVECLMRKHFIFILEDRMGYLKMAIDLNETVCVELVREHTHTDTTWYCYYEQEQHRHCLWKVTKMNGVAHYDMPELNGELIDKISAA